MLQKTTFTPEKTDRIVELLKGIAHPIRFRIVALLCERERTVSDLTGILGVRQSLVSQHLAQLRQLGLLDVERGGGWSVYMLKEKLLRRLVRCLSDCKAR